MLIILLEIDFRFAHVAALESTIRYLGIEVEIPLARSRSSSHPTSDLPLVIAKRESAGPRAGQPGRTGPSVSPSFGLWPIGFSQIGLLDQRHDLIDPLPHLVAVIDPRQHNPIKPGARQCGQMINDLLGVPIRG